MTDGPQIVPHQFLSPPLAYQCEFPGCENSFTTTQGRRVHHRSGHPEWYHARVAAAKPITSQWTEEEVSLLARKEALLTTRGVRYMNRELLPFGERTLGAIKGQRLKPTYKALVLRYIQELQVAQQQPQNPQPNPPTPTSPIRPTPSIGNNYPPPNDSADDIAAAELSSAVADRVLHSPSSETLRDPILASLRQLRRSQSSDFGSSELQSIIENADVCNKQQTYERLSLYLLNIFPPSRANSFREPRPPPSGLSNRRLRKHQYRMVQREYKKNRSQCIRNILEGIDGAEFPQRDIMEPYWRTVFTSTTDAVPPDLEVKNPCPELWSPISFEEIKGALPPAGTAAGPDGMTSRQFRKIPNAILVRILNLIIWCGKLPAHLSIARTVFIPKKSGAVAPGEFRPISITSIFARCLNKILATRVERFISLDDRQRAFRNGFDGCRDNVFLLDSMLRDRYTSYRSMYMATVDLSKAFDSVSHQALLSAAGAAGMPEPMLQYLKDFYKQASTTIVGCGWESDRIRVTRGVRQGDPLSPFIFNLVIDGLLRSLPAEVGISIGGKKINAAAFADDLFLVAETPVGLEHLLDHTNQYFEMCGLSINIEKSHTLSLVGNGHSKKTVVDASRKFYINGRALRALGPSDEWEYLGVTFAPSGRKKSLLSGKVIPLLDKLTHAPLKPQQRLFALKVFVLPKCYHVMALGRVNVGELNRVDKNVRAALRRWLALPHDTPVGYFHAPVGEGGLGVPSLRWLAPIHRLKRLLGLAGPSAEDVGSKFLLSEIARCQRRLNDHGVMIDSPKEERARWTRLLHQSIDGRSLAASRVVPGQHKWVSDGTSLLSGRDFVNAIKVRIGALPTLSRTSRGRYRDRACRAGCCVPETLNHVLQQCHRTYGPRNKRHDFVVGILADNLRKQGFTVQVEPDIPTREGVRRPDIVATHGGFGVVIDPQIVSEQTDLHAAFMRKRSKYADDPAINNYIRSTTTAINILHIPAILTWRGLWSQDSAEQLRAIGTINTWDLAFISTRVLIGGVICFRQFRQSTMVRYPGRRILRS